jgi:hypothetical protein
MSYRTTIRILKAGWQPSARAAHQACGRFGGDKALQGGRNIIIAVGLGAAPARPRPRKWRPATIPRSALKHTFRHCLTWRACRNPPRATGVGLSSRRGRFKAPRGRATDARAGSHHGGLILLTVFACRKTLRSAQKFGTAGQRQIAAGQNENTRRRLTSLAILMTLRQPPHEDVERGDP